MKWNTGHGSENEDAEKGPRQRENSLGLTPKS